MPALLKPIIGVILSIGRDLLMGPFMEWFLFWGLEQAAKSSRTTVDDELVAKMKAEREAAKERRENK